VSRLQAHRGGRKKGGNFKLGVLIHDSGEKKGTQQENCRKKASIEQGKETPSSAMTLKERKTVHEKEPIWVVS